MWFNMINGLYCRNVSNNINAYFDSSTYIDFSHDECLYIDDSYIWHLRLRHINKIKMKKLFNIGLIPNMNMGFNTCESCISSKMSRFSFSKGKRSNESLAIIHFDVCSLLNVKTITETWNIL